MIYLKKFNESITIRKENFDELVDNYLFNKEFFDYFKSRGFDIELNDKKINIFNNNDITKIFITYKDTYFNSRIRIDSKENKNAIYIEITYHGHTIYLCSDTIEFNDPNIDIYYHIKEFFINFNKKILSTSFSENSKKEVDDLEELIINLVESKKFIVYKNKQAEEKFDFLLSNVDRGNGGKYKAKLPSDLKILDNIKNLMSFYNENENSIYFYANFDYIKFLIKIHEQYSHSIYKLYKKIVNNEAY